MLAERFTARGFGGVRASYGSVLVPLFDRDGRRLGELAAASRLSKQAMTGLVNVLRAPQSTVFEYMADIEHLPEWATEFARELRREFHNIERVLGE